MTTLASSTCKGRMPLESDFSSRAFSVVRDCEFNSRCCSDQHQTDRQGRHDSIDHITTSCMKEAVKRGQKAGTFEGSMDDDVPGTTSG